MKHLNQISLILGIKGWFDIKKSLYIILNNYLWVTGGKSMIILTDSQKSFGKIQHPFFFFNSESRNRLELF